MAGASLRVVLAALAGVVVTTFGLLPPPAAAPTAAERGADVTPAVPDLTPRAAPALHIEPPAQPHTASAVTGNAHFRVDAQGQLILDTATAARLERLVDEAEAQGPAFDAGAVAARGLQEPQAGEARALLGAYMVYLSSRATLLGGLRMDEAPAAARQREDDIAALQRRLFGARAAAALFDPPPQGDNR